MSSLLVDCPSCFASAGRPCVWLTPTIPAGTFHQQRVDLAYMLSESAEPMPAAVVEKALEDLV